MLPKTKSFELEDMSSFLIQYIVVFLGVFLRPLDCGDLKGMSEICTDILDSMGFATKLELGNISQCN
jgi:hypothetical protein